MQFQDHLSTIYAQRKMVGYPLSLREFQQERAHNTLPLLQKDMQKVLRVITLFSGYDSQCLALDRLKKDFPNFNYELVAWCEIDKNAIKAHNALYPQWADRNLGDITQVDWSKVPDCDLVTWSFPCQSISSAGLQHGFKEDSGTRSSLAWECIKCFQVKRPKYMLMENVSAIMQKKFRADFAELQRRIEDLGYNNFVQLMNAKDYGVPQNRLRCFMVSIRNDGENPCYIYPPHLS